MSEGQNFHIHIRNEEYVIEQIHLENETQYKVSTTCNYIMTIYRNEDGDWSANSDVQVLDDNLVSEIGAKIEFKDA